MANLKIVTVVIFLISSLAWAQSVQAESEIQEIQNRSVNLNPGEIKMVQASDEVIVDWLKAHHNTVLSVVRFVANGTAVAAVIMYSWNAPFINAIVVGLTMGIMQGALQYEVQTYRNWLQENSLVRNYGAVTSFFDNPLEDFGKRTYNGILGFVEEYGKWSLIHTFYLSMARLSMSIANIDNDLPADIGPNITNIFKTTARSLLSEGLGNNGLLKDVQVQIAKGNWSDQFGEIFQNAGTFLVSVGATTANSIYLMNPQSRVKLPYYLGALGLLFYLHAIFSDSYSPERTLTSDGGPVFFQAWSH